MPRASTSPRCASRLARSWFERPTSPRVAVSSSASESSVGAVDAVGGEPDVSPEVDNEAARTRVLGSIHAVYTRTFVAPYSSARARTRARTASKSPALAKAQPSAEQRNGCTENRTCSSERGKRALIAVKRESEENQRAPRRHRRQDENCTVTFPEHSVRVASGRRDFAPTISTTTSILMKATPEALQNVSAASLLERERGLVVRRAGMSAGGRRPPPLPAPQSERGAQIVRVAAASEEAFTRG
jgi:hypothetical protein